MKKVFIIFCLLGIVSQTGFAFHIVKAPGSTTNVFGEFPIKGVLDADTLFIEGGTGDIYLTAGTIDDADWYDWNIGTGSLQTFQITFGYINATADMGNGAKGRLIAVSKVKSGIGYDQYLYVVYRPSVNLPAKPTTPNGPGQACAGSSSNYSSTSTNADSYQWTLTPAQAGTVVGNSSTITINWSSSWSGIATLTSKGINGSGQSPLSDPKSITINTTPTKPSISGDDFVEKGRSSVYIGVSNGNTWNWYMNPSNLASSQANGSQTTLTFNAIGTISLTSQTSNGCGTSSMSDPFMIRIVDVADMQQEIVTLKSAIVHYQDSIDYLVTDTLNKRTTINQLTVELDTAISQRELAIQKKNEAVVEKLLAISLLTDAISQRDSALLERDQAILERDNAIASSDSSCLNSIQNLEQELELATKQKNDAVVEKLLAISLLTDAISQRDSALLERDQAILERDKALANADSSCLASIQILEQERDQSIADKNQAIIQRDEAVSDKNNALLQRDQAITEKNNAVSQRDNAIVERDQAIADKNQAIAQRDEALDSLHVLQQVWILDWEVSDVVTKVFETSLAKFEVSLYPNPNPGEVFIESSETIESLKITNIQGQVVLHKDVNNKKTSFVLTRSEFANGNFYFAIIKLHNGGTVTKKFIFKQ